MIELAPESKVFTADRDFRIYRGHGRLFTRTAGAVLCIHADILSPFPVFSCGMG